jgi:mRNA degradation ribonuclease J1/J2
MVKQETTLTFYGGVNEIGGNKILLKDGDTKIFFDFGMSFSMRRLFYSPPFLSPKSERSLQELGILPSLTASTSLTANRQKLVLCLFLMATWTTQPTCLS